MAKFYALGTYTEESFQAFIKNPKQDRKAAVNALSSACLLYTSPSPRD